MKKVLFACIAAAAMSAPAHAAGPYIGLGATVVDRGDDQTVHKTSVKLFGGYDFSDTWGVEAGLLGLPEYAAWTRAGVGGGNAKGQTLYVAGKATMPIVGKLSLVTKLGLAQTRVKFYDGLDSSHYNSTGLYAGIGLKYALTERTAVTLELERLGRAPKDVFGGARRETVSLNLSHNF